MKAKEFLINHIKKGTIPVGKLSHNESCRAIMDLAITNQQLTRQLQILDLQYANHLASIDSLDVPDFRDIMIAHLVDEHIARVK